MKYSVKIRELSDDSNLLEEITEKYQVSPIVAKILIGRGFSAEEIDLFLNPSLKNLPQPSLMKGMTEACALIGAHVASRIGIAGDFDVDGLSSISILKTFLDSQGISNNYYVPDRFKEGYGLNERMIDDAASDGASLLICLDFGSSNGPQLEYAKSKGLATLVVDHHHVYENPSGCDVFVNPMQQGCQFPHKNLCSAGLTWYLCAFLSRQLPQCDFDAKSLLDLATLGTVCDMVPLLGVNRIIASKGLVELSETERLGIRALREEVGVQRLVTPYDIGFGFGPRINAAGRLRDGKIVVEMLTTTEWSVAKRIASELNKLNSKRQKTEAVMREAVLNFVKNQETVPWGIVVADETFHVGVIGIVASRLVEAFHRPSVVLGTVDDEEETVAGDCKVFKGSVRGIPGFNVVEALDSLKFLLDGYGGHVAAGGLSIKESNIDQFVAGFNEEALRQLGVEGFIKQVEVDVEISLRELDFELWQNLQRLEPTGIGNRKPIFYAKDVEIIKVISLKGGHYSLVMTQGENKVEAIWWKAQNHVDNLQASTRGDVVFKLEINDYRGTRNLRMNIINFFLS